ncbi:unnamed protein product, partial [Medioppia subpectinata]
IVLNSMHKYQPRVHLVMRRDPHTVNNPIVLNSMHKYQPRVHLVYSALGVCQLLGHWLDLVLYMAWIQKGLSAFINNSISSYCFQCLGITKLKIDSNPFAKGFRDSSRLTDIERESLKTHDSSGYKSRREGDRDEDTYTGEIQDLTHKCLCGSETMESLMGDSYGYARPPMPPMPYFFGPGGPGGVDEQTQALLRERAYLTGLMGAGGMAGMPGGPGGPLPPSMMMRPGGGGGGGGPPPSMMWRSPSGMPPGAPGGGGGGGPGIPVTSDLYSLLAASAAAAYPGWYNQAMAAAAAAGGFRSPGVPHQMPPTSLAMSLASAPHLWGGAGQPGSGGSPGGQASAQLPLGLTTNRKPTDQ